MSGNDRQPKNSKDERSYNKRTFWPVITAVAGGLVAVVTGLATLTDDIPKIWNAAKSLVGPSVTSQPVTPQDASAMYTRGQIYEHGVGVTRDYAKARDWYQKAADRGNANAMYDLGFLYEEGWGGAQDYAEACELYRRAADMGHLNAMFMIGLCYENGKGVVQDYGKAREWYQKSLDRGDTDAKARLEQLPIR